MEKYYIYPVNDSIGKLLEEMICEKTLNNYYVKAEKEVVEALQELGYINGFEIAPEISIPKDEQFRKLDV